MTPSPPMPEDCDLPIWSPLYLVRSTHGCPHCGCTAEVAALVCERWDTREGCAEAEQELGLVGLLAAHPAKTKPCLPAPAGVGERGTDPEEAVVRRVGHRHDPAGPPVRHAGKVQPEGVVFIIRRICGHRDRARHAAAIVALRHLHAPERVHGLDRLAQPVHLHARHGAARITLGDVQGRRAHPSAGHSGGSGSSGRKQRRRQRRVKRRGRCRLVPTVTCGASSCRMEAVWS
jgi:hypothetical protein